MKKQKRYDTVRIEKYKYNLYESDSLSEITYRLDYIRLYTE